MFRKAIVLASVVWMISGGVRCVNAQEPPRPAQEAPKPADSNNNAADIQWVWGEVVSVDPAEKSLIIKYLDYDTDEEKTMKIMAADTTSYEEASGLAAIRAADTVSVEYNVLDGKNQAKVITVEKVEDADTGNDQQMAPPEKVGGGPVSETEGPATRAPEPTPPAPASSGDSQ
ncbi:MAG: hypothetical protein ACM3OC_08735 [Deltaproteobacteria bacterium]